MSPCPERGATGLRAALTRLQRRARPAADGWARPGRRTIYILPTREGLLLLPALAAAGLIGLHYNNNAALAVTFLLASAALVGALHTWRELAGLAVRAAAAGESFAGGRQRFVVRLRGEGRSRHVRVAAGGAAAEAGVPADGTAEVVLALEAPRRGRLSLGPLRVETTRPLGLFRAWTLVETGAGAWVYPRPAPPRPLPDGGAVARGTEAPARAAGPEGELHDLAPWRPGESLRRIHWPLAARGRGLHARRFAAPLGAPRMLRWDACAGDAEARLSVLCRWVLDAHRRGLEYGLVLPGRTVPAGTGPRQRARCLEALARWPG